MLRGLRRELLSDLGGRGALGGYVGLAVGVDDSAGAAVAVPVGIDVSFDFYQD